MYSPYYFNSKQNGGNMRKNIFILIGLITILTVGLQAREKTEPIGKFQWYTEQNTFEEMVQIAQKAGKPILAVFSATWCVPCQQVKKTVFMIDDFKQVADEVILLYIEQTTPEGGAYNKKFKVNVFPTFKILSKNGELLDNGNVERTVDGFLKWIKDVKAGKNFYELSKKLEKKPNDRETILNIVDKLDYFDRSKRLEYLKQAVKINPDFKDELSQKVYEKLAQTLIFNIPQGNEKGKTEFLKENRPLFLDIVNAYYPGKFKYELKGNQGMAIILNWFNRSEDFDKSISIINDFLKQKGEKLDMINDIDVISEAIPAYIGQGKINEADNWITKTRTAAANAETLKKDQKFLYYYFNMYNAIVKHYGEKKDIKEAEKYALIQYDEMSRLGQEKLVEYTMRENASRYGIMFDKILGNLEESSKTAKGEQVAFLVVSQAELLAKSGKKEEAEKRLIRLYENEEYFKTLKPESIPEILNEIAWAMVEAKIVSPKSLEIAKKAVALNPSHMELDTLACVYAGLGNFKDAVETEKEALNKVVNDEGIKKYYSERIKKWEKELK
jgi:thioredoxin-related protein